MISGTGFAMANKMESLFMEETISGVTMPGAETPTKMSAPFRASARVPVLPERFVSSAIFSCIQLRPLESFEMIPALSHMIILEKP